MKEDLDSYAKEIKDQTEQVDTQESQYLQHTYVLEGLTTMLYHISINENERSQFEEMNHSTEFITEKMFKDYFAILSIQNSET